MSDLSNINVTAFIEPAVRMHLDQPRTYTALGGGVQSTSWILAIGDRNDIHLHFRDKADLYRLVDEITAKAGPR